MITGSVMIARVSEAEMIELPNRADSTKAPRPNSACTMLGTPARFITARLMMRLNQLSPGVLVEVNRRQHADRAPRSASEMHNQVDGAEQRRPDAAVPHAVARVRQQEIEREDRPRLAEQVADDEHQRDDHQQRHRQEDGLGDELGVLLAARERGGVEHSGPIDWTGAVIALRMPRTMRSAVRLTTKVIVNSSTPMMNSTW